MATNDFGTLSSNTAGVIRGLDSPDQSWPQDNRVGEGVLRANYLANTAGGPTTGFLFDKDIPASEEAVMEYDVKFGPNFFWAGGGKLPGLGGTSLSSNGAIPAGCTEDLNKINNGFSARLMWRQATRDGSNRPPFLVVYTYFPDRDISKCGVDIKIMDIVADRWYKVRQYIKLNTPGVRNGILEMYIDGQLMLRETNVLYRNAGKSNVKINSAIFHTYRGGTPNDELFHSPRNENVFFDNFKVWIGCDTPGGGTNPNPITGAVPTDDIYSEDGTVINTQELRVENATTRTRKAYMKFNLSSLSGTVDNASLKLTATGAEEGNGTVNIYLGSNASWSEGSTGTLSARGALLGSYTGDVAFNQSININLTGLPIGGNVTLIAEMASGGNDVSFVSSEGNAPPQLNVTTTPTTPTNVPPTVSFINPSSNLTVQEGYSLTINVNASDSDGTVSQVELFRDGTLIRPETIATYDWGHTSSPNPNELNGLSAGTYVFKAVATDNDGATSEDQFTLTVTSSGGTPPSGNVSLQYQVGDASATDNAIKPNIKLFNNSTTPIPYNDLKLRYYFTAEGSGTPTFTADYAAFGTTNVTGTIVNTGGLNYYAEVSFTSAAGSLAAGANSGNIKIRINYSDWSNHDETNDYSYTGSQTSYANYNKITVYQNGTLIWGTAPNPGGLMTARSSNALNLDEPLQTSLSIYPNPAQSSFVIDVSSIGKSIVNIYNISGAKIYQGNLEGKTTIPRTEKFKPGVHVVKIYDAKGNIYTQKLIIE